MVVVVVVVVPIALHNIWTLPFLPTALAREVMQSTPSVRPFVATLSLEPTDLELLYVSRSWP